MSESNSLIDEKPKISAIRLTCKLCPFCGSRPFVDLGKRGSCQLHGEPFQSVVVYCKNKMCAARPRIEAGDIYNGGKDKAEAEAVKLWNRRDQ